MINLSGPGSRWRDFVAALCFAPDKFANIRAADRLGRVSISADRRILGNARHCDQGENMNSVILG
jgi:hypothetical protein